MKKMINLKIVKVVGTALAMAGMILCTGVCTIKAEDTTAEVTRPAKTPQVGGEEVTPSAKIPEIGGEESTTGSLGQIGGADRDIVTPINNESNTKSTTSAVMPVNDSNGSAVEKDKIPSVLSDTEYVTEAQLSQATEKLGEVAADTAKVVSASESTQGNKKVSVWPYVMMGIGAFMVSFIIGESIFVKNRHKKEK
ncbi:MAG: hypothetical protein Q4F06_04605 [Eubacteriales bacterium]|nr:hypothetical protein [Eubacteriales bacterium]